MADSTSHGSSSGRGFLIGGGVLAAALLAFIVQNTQTIAFNWLFWTFSEPLWIMLLVTAFAAFVIGQFALMWRRHKRRQARRDSR